MRFPLRLHPAWVIATTLLFTLAPAHAARGQKVDSLPNLPWAEIYFAEFDPAARAAGLEPLRTVRVPARRADSLVISLRC